MTAAPLCVLPAKDTVEELFYKKKLLDKKRNILVTLVLVFLCFLLSISIDKIGDTITLAGATINPVVSTNETSHLPLIDWLHYPSILLLEGKGRFAFLLFLETLLPLDSHHHHCRVYNEFRKLHISEDQVMIV